MQTSQDLLSSAYKHFNGRDIDSVLTTMHPEVDWPNGMEGGRVHGHTEVRQYWLRQWAVMDPHVEPVSFIPRADGRTIVRVRQVVRDLTGKVLLDRIVQHIYLLQDGLIRSMEIVEDDPA